MHSPTIVEEIFNFLPLLIVFLLAFLVPILMNRFRQVPVVVGEILAGVLIGGSVLGLVHKDAIMGLLGDFGLAFLMFLAGLEIDFDMLFPSGANDRKRIKSGSSQDGGARKAAPNLLAVALLFYILTLVLASPIVIALNRLTLLGSLEKLDEVDILLQN